MSELHPIPRVVTGEPRADVVFIHGLGGDPLASWRHDSQQPDDCWPFWLAQEVPEVQVYCLCYPADWTHWFGGEAMPLFDRAKSILNLMAAEGLGRRPLVFVCHSLGGLVVKQILRQGAEGANPDWHSIAEQTRALVFVATPHAGADLARTAERLGLITLTTPVMADLKAHAPALRGLNEWFRHYVASAELRVLCYYETRTTGTKRVRWLGQVVATGIKVVEEADADPGLVGVIPVPLDTDHFGACKPDRRDRPLCKDLLQLVRDTVAGAKSAADAGPNVAYIKMAAASAQHLPADLPDFQGREGQIERLKAILNDGSATVIAITGMGGVGKSALALHVAHQLLDTAPDGRVFVDLGGASVQPLTPLTGMIRVIQAVQPTARVPPESDPVQILYRGSLDGKRMLLLLDNAENTAQVAPLIEWRAPTTLVIVTARHAITGPGIANFHLDVMEPGEACDLLRGVLAGRPATNDELNALGGRCGRLPLALRVAGTFLALNRDWTIGEYLEALADERQRLGLLRIEDDPRLNVEAVLGLSARKLAEDNPMLAERWKMLAVFPQSLDRKAAATVWEAPEANTRRSLSELVRRSMLFFGEADGRYRLHDLIRDVGRLPLEKQEETVVRRRLDAAAARHAHHYCKVLATANTLFLRGGRDVLAGLALFDLEQLNIAAGQAWAAERIERSDDAARLAAAYADAGAHVLGLRMHSRLLICWLETQIVACRKLANRPGEETALLNLGTAFVALGEPRRAIELYEQALAIARELMDRRGEGGALGNIGIAWAQLGELQRAIGYHEQDLAVRHEIGDLRGEGAALGNIGIAYHKIGRPQRAIEYHRQALAIMRTVGDRLVEGGVLGNLGMAFLNLGEPRRAIELYEQALAIARELGDRRGEGAALSNMGTGYKELGEPQRAIEYLEQALAIARDRGDRRNEAGVLGDLGLTKTELGELRGAIEHSDRALAIAREIGARGDEGKALNNLGNVYFRLGEVGSAINLLNQALVIMRQIGNRMGEGAALGNLGNAYAELGEPQRAIGYYEQHLEIAREVGDRRGEGSALVNLGLALDELGKRYDAIATTKAGLMIFEQIGATHQAEKARAKLAEWQANR